MNIYVAHSKNYDYKKELYEPIKKSHLNKIYTFVLPHEQTDKLFNSKTLFTNQCDLVLAEVSISATGLGIELGWANILNIPILCIHKKGIKPSNSLKAISKDIFEYSNQDEMISILEKFLKKNIT